MHELSEVMDLLKALGVFLVSIAAMVVIFKVGGLVSALSGRIKDGSF